MTVLCSSCLNGSVYIAISQAQRIENCPSKCSWKFPKLVIFAVVYVMVLSSQSPTEHNKRILKGKSNFKPVGLQTSKLRRFKVGSEDRKLFSAKLVPEDLEL